jgi:AmmeMemoRadiSam system protein B
MTRPAATRPPAVAGVFYPADPDRLAAEVDALLAAASMPEGGPEPLAVVSPHAGYRYSGPVAATAYRRLAPLRGSVRRAVVLGPAHFTRVDGMALPGWAAFGTPLGMMRVDEPACALAATLPGVVLSDAAHSREHSVEVQLPFLQRTLGAEITIVPVVVGPVEAHLVAHVMEALAQDDSTVIVVSTDLSHYHDQATAGRLDRRTAEAIVRRDPLAIGQQDACGCYPLRGLLEFAHRHDLDVRLFDLRTSGDTAGERSQVVGYGAFGVYRQRGANVEPARR